MSGVRNLRAMFEQSQQAQGSNPPDDRGRSPGPSSIRSVGSPSPTESPRPLSKVRTSFVAVEKDGRMGLKRENSGDSMSVSSRRLSNDTEATTPQPVADKPDLVAENMAKNVSAFKKNLAQESIPESPIQDLPPVFSPKREERTRTPMFSPKREERSPMFSPKKEERSPMFSPKKEEPPPVFSPKKEEQIPEIAPNSNPDKITDEEEPKAKLLPGNPTDTTATRGSGAASNGLGEALKINPASSPKAKAATTKPATKTAAPISTTGKSVTKAPKSPMALKSPMATKAPTKAPAKEPAKATSLAPEKKAPARSASREPPRKTTTTRPAATTSKKPAPIDPPPSGAAVVKPKPKSPTRPVKLPSSLTTHTAASASKLGSGGSAAPAAAAPAPAPRRSLSRASGNTASNRSSSRTSVGAASGNNRLKRQNSTINRPRPTIGPPPKQAAKDHPVTKKESHVDDGFLARMMRPTQSSSSKAAEKGPVTPPGKHSAPTTVPKKTVNKDVEGSAKKAAAKIQTSTNKPKAAAQSAKSVTKNTATAKEVAPVVAQAASAEDAIKTAKISADTAVTPAVEKKESEAVPTAKEVAPVVAQTETAEDAIETAKISANTAVTPLVEKTEVETRLEPTKVAESQPSPVAKSPEPATAVPAISQDPQKVEDIEDLVQEATLDPVEQKAPTEQAQHVVEEPIQQEKPEEEELIDVSAFLPVDVTAGPRGQVAPIQSETTLPVNEAKVQEPFQEQIKAQEATVQDKKIEETNAGTTSGVA